VVTHATPHGSLTGAIRTGDIVALHWDWICDVISVRQMLALRSWTARILRMTNDALARPVAAAALD
jgi:hypothetical protein